MKPRGHRYTSFSYKDWSGAKAALNRLSLGSAGRACTSVSSLPHPRCLLYEGSGRHVHIFHRAPASYPKKAR